MMLLRHTLQLFLIFQCLAVSSAVRGSTGNRDNRLRRRTTSQAKGVVVKDSRQKMTEHAHAVVKKMRDAKKTGEGKSEKPSSQKEADSDEDVESEEEEQETEEKGKERPAKKSSKPKKAEGKQSKEGETKEKGVDGKSKASKTRVGYDSEDTNIYSEALEEELSGNDLVDSPRTNVDPLDEPETMERIIPVFSMKFRFLNNDWKDVDMGDYNELAVVTTEFLDKQFDKEFLVVPATHHQTFATVQVVTDARIVDLHVRSQFVVPGDVPTMHLMFEKIKSAFEGVSVEEYIKLLREMSSTNPYSFVKSVTLMNHGLDSVAGDGSNGNKPNAVTRKKSVMIPFLAGVGFLVLIIVGFFWVRWRRVRREIEIMAKQTSTDDGEDSTLPEGSVNPVKNGSTNYSTRFYGADEETLRYLSTVRQKYRYRDDEGSSSSKSSTDLDDISLEESDEGSIEEEPESIETYAEKVQVGDLLSLHSPVPVMSDLLAKTKLESQNDALSAIDEAQTGEEECVQQVDESISEEFKSEETSRRTLDSNIDGDKTNGIVTLSEVPMDERNFDMAKDKILKEDDVDILESTSLKAANAKSKTPTSASMLAKKFDYLKEMNATSFDADLRSIAAEEEKAELKAPAPTGSSQGLNYLQAMNTTGSFDSEDLRSIA